MKVEQAKQIANKAIEQLSHALEAGHSEKLREYLTAMARLHRYSLHNIMLIASQRPDATHVAGSFAIPITADPDSGAVDGDQVRGTFDVPICSAPAGFDPAVCCL